MSLKVKGTSSRQVTEQIQFELNQDQMEAIIKAEVRAKMNLPQETKIDVDIRVGQLAYATVQVTVTDTSEYKEIDL